MSRPDLSPEQRGCNGEEQTNTRKYPEGYILPLQRSEDRSTLNGLELYAPRAFKATSLMVGNPESSIALCTSWADPWNIVDEQVIECVSIAAPLRTPNGIGVLIANLAQNPTIREIAIWTGGEWDNGAAALLPRDYLIKLFTNGIDDSGVINGTSFQLPDELIVDGGLDIVRNIIENVQLTPHIQNRKQLTEILSVRKELGAYMEPHVFPDFEIRTPETLPSERQGFLVREKTIDKAWLRILDRITRYGQDTYLETGGARIRELEFARVIIDNQKDEFIPPAWMQELPNLPISPEALETYFYTKILPGTKFITEIYDGVPMFKRPDSVSYLYSEQMFASPRDSMVDNAVNRIYKLGGLDEVYKFLSQNPRNAHAQAIEYAQMILADLSIDDNEKIQILLELFVPPTNQIAKLIERIKTTPDDADKVFVLWDPETHGMRDRGRPCAIEGAILVRNGKIDMKVEFRSHDMAKAWLENTYGFWRLQKYIAEKTGYEPGVLIVDSESAHMYEMDVPWVKGLVENHIWNEQPSIVFDAEEMSDRRGNWVVNVVDGEIICMLQDPVNAQPLQVLKGRTAKRIIGQLRHLGLIEKPDHALDIGAQLMSAEVCNLLGLPYVQDRSINFRSLRN
jgi:tetrahydromethanopterin S-methyltransferase subunit A